MNSNMKSFGEWCEENDLQVYVDYWCNDINRISPYELPMVSSKKMAFWCGNPDHHIFYRQPSNIIRSKNIIICPGCESLGQYIVDTFGREYLDAIWSDKNTKSSFEVRKSSTTEKVWFRCLNNPNHPDYESLPANFHRGARCPYCDGKKICYENSLAKMMPEVIDLWSEKNEKGPDEYPTASDKKVWLKCFNHKHDDFQRRLGNIKTFGCECPECMRGRVAQERAEDLTGRTFGRLTVIGTDPDDLSKCICECSCDDHTVLSVQKSHLKNGWTTSCGCYQKERTSGENSHLWKGGITEHNQEGRYTAEYRRFRSDVMKRDKYTCQCCGKVGGDLQVHHIHNYIDNEDLRYDTLNGITLCDDCHSQNVEGSFHRIYGVTNNTPEQLEEFINTRRAELGIEEHFSLEEYVRGNKELEEMAHERFCTCCGTKYKYCPTCKSFKNLPKWKALFDTETCHTVFEIVSGYNTGSIRPGVAKARLSGMNLDGITFKENIQAKIDEILAYEEPKKASVSDEQVSVDEEPKPRRGRRAKKEAEAVEETPEESGEEKVEPEESGENKAEEVAEEAAENVNND